MESPRSSYKSAKLTYEHIFQLICFFVKPKHIVEYGILDGFSLNSFRKYSDSTCKIEAYDIFDDFVGNHADQKEMTNLFKGYPNVLVAKGDFYKHYTTLQDNSIDIIHIDIANTGDVYKFAYENYLSKLTNNGIMILEGGSQERDLVWWMEKYNKPKITDFLSATFSLLPLTGLSSSLHEYEYCVICPHPSITIIRRKSDISQK